MLQKKRGVGLQLHLFLGAEFLELKVFGNIELERSYKNWSGAAPNTLLRETLPGQLVFQKDIVFFCHLDRKNLGSASELNLASPKVWIASLLSTCAIFFFQIYFSCKIVPHPIFNSWLKNPLTSYSLSSKKEGRYEMGAGQIFSTLTRFVENACHIYMSK